MQPNDPARPDAAAEPLTRRSRELFDAAVAATDAATRSRLNRARQAALLAAHGPAAQTRRWMLPAGGMAAAALATIMTVHYLLPVTPPQHVVPAASTAASVVDDLELITAEADFDMLKDLEFYAWLEPAELTDATREAG